MLKIEHLFLAAIVAVSGGCAPMAIPYKPPVTATPPSGRVIVSEAITLFDASGSQDERFADGKATLESVVGVMPDGNYKANLITFGGFDREATGLSTFNRSALKSSARNATYLKGTTPIFDVLENDVAASIGGTSGRAAIVLISDGLATDYSGRAGADEATLEAARALAGSRPGETCFHTIQSGDDMAGTALLKSLAKSTRCGSFRNATSLASASALQQFSRDVYLGSAPAPRPKPVAPKRTPVVPKADTDGDGVLDSMDACAGTLKKARVDNRGCWTLSNLRFAVNGAGIEAGFTESLRQDLEVLRANPGVRIRIDGHTDSDGSAAYNKGLSTRRAASVRDYFVKTGGLDPKRFDVMGFGESRPIVANDTPANKRRNRRVELTIIE